METPFFVSSLAIYLQSLSWIATGTGVFFSVIIFLFGAKELQKLNIEGRQPTCVDSIEDQVAISDKDGKYDENDCRNPATKEPKRRLRTNSTHSSITVSQDQDPCSKAS